MTKRLALFYIMIMLSLAGPAQVLYPDSELIDYYRLIELKNPQIDQRVNINPSILNQYSKDSVKWNLWSEYLSFNNSDKNGIRPLPIRFANHYNDKLARGYNDGAVWKGKGYTGSLQGGFQGQFGILSFSFAPIAFFAQNRSFELAESTGTNNLYNYQFKDKLIDYVQRYGDEPFSSFDLGQSELRVVLRWFTVGISTQNYVWGPTQRNPLLMSNNAAGIPHLDIGTHKPVNTKIGLIETKVYYGLLNQSEYFGEGDWKRFWSGFSFGYSPKFMPNASISFNRSFYKNANEFSPLDLLVYLEKFDDTDGDPAVNDEYDQIASITLRWQFPEVGFDAYCEYGKNDFGGEFWSPEANHARAYTLGFSKYIDIFDNHVLKLTYEHVSADKSKSYTYRQFQTWYSHYIVRAGYTINGQVIGAGVGPGSTSEYFEAQYFFPSGRWQVSAQQTRFDHDYFNENVQSIYRHYYEWNFESRFSKFYKDYLIGIDFGISFRKNQYFIEGNNTANPYFGLNVTKNFDFF